MRKLIGLVVLVAANLTGTSLAADLDLGEGAAEATFSWRLGFGGAGAPQPGYGLAVGYRGHGPDPIFGRLFQLDVDGPRAFARIAGLPLYERDFRIQLDDAAADAPRAADTPWYARQWVWWTAGGLAATMALTGGDGDVEYTHNSSTTNRGAQGCSTGSASVGETEAPCASEEVGTQCVEGEDGQVVCVFCGNNGVTDGCNELTDRRVVARRALDVEHQRWLDAGTGHMGDLAAR